MKQKFHILTLLALSICAIPTAFAQHHHHQEPNEKAGAGTYHGMKMTHAFLEDMEELRDTSSHDDPTKYGAWETVIPKFDGAALGHILGMQTVHNVLLPSGKILISSGSSWRNFKDIETYPEYEDPAPAMGLFNLYNDPFRNTITFKLEDGSTSRNIRKENYYNLVNNTAIYDPVENTFYRIPHPVPVTDPDDTTHFIPSDLFCSGHLQLADGNALFIGGTQYYFPYRTGTRSTYIFDWKEELRIDWSTYDWRKMPEEDSKYYPWTFSGLLKRGRWYPNMVPLPDGRLTVFSGFVGFDPGYEPMYRFQINSYIEFFDPYAFDVNDPQKAWKSVDIQNLPNSPFSTEINPHFQESACTDSEFHSYWESLSCENKFPLPCECDSTCEESNRYDAFKLYPNNYLVAKNKIYLTREGDWVSLRTADTYYMRRTKKTYFMNVLGTAENPNVSFDEGPDRPEEITSYGTSYADPNTENITILGGQPTSPGTLFPIGAAEPTHFAGGRGSRKREQFWFDPNDLNSGKWSMDDDFLGDEPQDDRTMLTAIILPTRQVLIINGGNFDFYGPTFTPILLTPVFDEQGQFVRYTKTKMNEALEPRLYHNAALLLPNGKIWVSGGNSARASVSAMPQNQMDQHRNGQPKPDPALVDLNMYFYRDGQMAKAVPGMQSTPTENWTAELFSPPYIFIDSGRTASIEEIRNVKKISKSQKLKETIAGKEFYLLKSNQEYEMSMTNLPEESSQKAEVVLLKLPSFTHNWDSGQLFLSMEITREQGNKLIFKTPDMQQDNIPPGYYMLYYVDSKGKPSHSQMIRFDDRADCPLQGILTE